MIRLKGDRGVCCCGGCKGKEEQEKPAAYRYVGTAIVAMARRSVPTLNDIVLTNCQFQIKTLF